MKKFFKIILSPFLGKRRFQGFFRLLYQFSLKGMNYGGGADFRESGEAWVLKYMKMHHKTQIPFVLFDVGANEGGYALAADKVLTNCKIYAFEPAPRTFEKLKAAVSGFSNIQIFNFGLGAQKGQARLFFSEAASGLASLYDRPVLKSKEFGTTSVQVDLDTIDDFCAQNGVSRIDFLKLDVEGHELEVLKGARGMLEDKKIDFIQFEFGGTDVDARVFLKDFFELLGPAYAINRILKDGLEPVSYNETKEIFTTTNYLAVSKVLFDKPVKEHL